MLAGHDTERDANLKRLKVGLFFRQYNAWLALLVGISFGAVLWAVILFFPASFSPYESLPSFGLCVVIDLTGSILIAIAAYDVLQRVLAKRELAMVLIDFSEEDYDQLRMEIQLGPRLAMFRFLAVGNEPRELHFPAWIALMKFLGSPLGQLASQALLQRSRSGRVKYLDNVMSMARRERRQLFANTAIAASRDGS